MSKVASMWADSYELSRGLQNAFSVFNSSGSYLFTVLVFLQNNPDVKFISMLNKQLSESDSESESMCNRSLNVWFWSDIDKLSNLI